MGESQRTVPRFSFNRSIHLAGTDERLSSIAGLLLLRELDDRWRVTARLSEAIVDTRESAKVSWSMAAQVRARIFALAAGYSSQRDVTELAGDPIVRLTTSDRRGSSPLVESAEISQPTLARMHRQLGSDANQQALGESLFDLGWRVIRDAAKAEPGTHTIDIDSMPVMSHGEQPGSVWNGYYRGRCFHPLMAVHGETGTMLAARLRPGNVPSAAEATSFVLEVVERLESELGRKVRVRGDSSFANDNLLSALEARGSSYIFHMARNPRIERMAADLLKPTKGARSREPREWLHSLTYSSLRWPTERRVILVVQETPGELYLHHFFLVTNDWRSSPQTILERYRQRGTTESRFGELKSRLEMKLSCTSNQGDEAREKAWRANEGTFLLYLIADGLLHALRWLSKYELSSDGESLPKLQRVQRLLVDVAARVTRSARRVHVHLANSANELWMKVLARFARLRPVT